MVPSQKVQNCLHWAVADIVCYSICPDKVYASINGVEKVQKG